MSSPLNVPQDLQDAWAEENWRVEREETGKRREAALPELRAMLERFIEGETGLAQFAKESQDFSFAQPHWGFKGFGQMQLNQYAKVGRAANQVDEAERVLRDALSVPTDEAKAGQALNDVVQLTHRFAQEANRLELGKPAPGRVPLVVSYFWEAQVRDEWPIVYRASKEGLAASGLFQETNDPVASYLAFRSTILTLGDELGGDVWDIEALLWVLRPQKSASVGVAGTDTSRVWLVRAGEKGAHESLALSEGAAVIGWSELGELSKEVSRDELKEMIRATYGEERAASLASQAGQIHRFIHDVAVDDLVVLPRLAERGHVAIGRITGDYAYRNDDTFAGSDARNTRPVEWLADAVRYERFDADLREAFGQQGTVSEIDKPAAAERLLAAVEGVDASAIHLVLKWTPAVDPETIDHHREVAAEHGAVWWGRLGSKGSTGLAQRWLKKLQQQLQQGSTTYVFLYNWASTWRTQLLSVSLTLPEEATLIPPYYDPNAHHTLWVKLDGFEKVEADDITDHFVLAQSGAPVTQGGLGNQGPLIIRAKSAVTEVGPPGAPELGAQFGPESVRATAEALGLILPSSLYHQVVAALESGKHVILTGPPGTAKTTLAQAVANAAKSAGRTTGYVLTTATADWTTFETIGGLRPTSSGELHFEEGHFLAAIRADSWLVIDELNRSNFDRAFGQLFTVLSGQAVVLPYHRPGFDRPLTLVPDGAEAPVEDADVLSIPQSWRVIATMNVFDKTLLFEMSFALMRRFAFIEVPSPSAAIFEALIEKETAGATEAADLARQLLAVREIKDLGPAVFMDLARFVRERLALDPTAEPGDVLYEAFYAYLLPQFEGIDDVTGESLFKKVSKIVGSSQRERLRKTLNAVLGLDLVSKPPVDEEEEIEEPEEPDQSS
jgi:MoxR-like ATPase